jgi:hypothetical protein
MMKYAKVRRETGEIVEYRDLPEDTEFADHKPEVWLPVVEEALAGEPIDGDKKVEMQIFVDLEVGEVVHRQTVVTLTPAEKARWAKGQLSHSDRDNMPRLAEDVLDVLVAKGVIALTDLPQVSQDKIAERKSLRARLK